MNPALFGKRLSLNYAWIYLAIIVLLPLAMIVLAGGELGLQGMLQTVTSARAIAALKLSFACSLLAAVINVVLGTLVAWVLVRDRFIGRRLLDAIVDLPFAMPTAVAGIALSVVYARNGVLGAPLAKLGIHVAHHPVGVVFAMIFVGFPFVVRTVQPVLEDFDPEVEEAAACLGASPTATFWRVLLPALRPALFSGFSLSFARALGEFGSVVFLAGSVPFKTEIAPLLIVSRLEQFDTRGAAGIATVLLAASAITLLVFQALEHKTMQRESP